jgi:hypothetical protein
MIVRALLVMTCVAVASMVRWFVRIANGAKGYAREPRPSSIDEYRARIGSRPRPVEHSA